MSFVRLDPSLECCIGIVLLKQKFRAFGPLTPKCLPIGHPEGTGLCELVNFDDLFLQIHEAKENPNHIDIKTL
jgi:hypothetical protein